MSRSRSRDVLSRSASSSSLNGSNHGGTIWSPAIERQLSSSFYFTRRVLSLVLLCLVLLVGGSVGWIFVRRPGTSEPQGRRPAKRELRVCIVYDAAASEPGLAVALAEVLRALTSSLHADVTALRLDDPRGTPLPAILGAAIDSAGGMVRWTTLPPTRHTYDASAAAVASYRALAWLRDARLPFDHIIFHASGGAGHYALLAREEGLALTQSYVTVVVLAPRQLLWRRRPGAGATIEELEEDHMQRGVAARADALVTSAAALRFMRAHRWKLPQQTTTWDSRRDARRAAQDEGEDEDTNVNPSDPRRSDALLTNLPQLWDGLPALRKVPKPDQLLAGLEKKVNLHANGATRSVHAPLVSVIVVHHERGPLLLQALDSIRKQTIAPRHVQAIVVDDGSTSAAALAVLDRVRNWPEMTTGRWLLLRRPWRYLGAARNEAARYASGMYIYFLDDDNCLKRHALHTLLTAAAVTNAHVLTSFNEKWKSQKAPPSADTEPTTERWLPLGDAAAVGIFKNCFGDAASLVRRSAFVQLGGFTEDGGVGHEDWELWARAVLRGYTLRVVPEPLYWYRLGLPGSMLAESIGGGTLTQAQRHANHARNIRPYLQRLAGWPEAQDAVRLVQGMYLKRLD